MSTYRSNISSWKFLQRISKDFGSLWTVDHGESIPFETDSMWLVATAVWSFLFTRGAFICLSHVFINNLAESYIHLWHRYQFLLDYDHLPFLWTYSMGCVLFLFHLMCFSSWTEDSESWWRFWCLFKPPIFKFWDPWFTLLVVFPFRESLCCVSICLLILKMLRLFHYKYLAMFVLTNANIKQIWFPLNSLFF